MKKILSLIAAVLITLSTFAQIDRSKAPAPGAAPEIKIGTAKSFELKNGLKVFVVENPKLPRVSFSLRLDNDPFLEKDKVGYADIAGQLLRRGTTSKSKAELDEEIDFIGAFLNTSSNGVFASSLSKHKEKVLSLMTDILFNPAFDQTEFDKIKKQTISELANQKDDPDAIGGNVTDVLNYGDNHPYGELTTEKTVENITLQDTKDFYNRFFKPNVAYLAIVGDVKFSDAKKLVKKYFSKWEKGSIKQEKFNTPKAPAKSYIALVDRPNSVQSLINISYPIDLKTGTPDVAKARVLNQILGAGASARLFTNLREDKGFTYGAYSNLSDDELVGDFVASASVRNEVTDSAVYEFLLEMNKIVNEEVSMEELKDAKAAIIGRFSRSLENPQTIAGLALNKARLNLPPDYYKNYLKAIEAVTIQDVKAAAKKYIRPENANIVVVGKGSEIVDKLKKFGEVKYFDNYGNNYEPSKAKIPAGFTVQNVFNKYFDAIGGRQKLESLKTLRVEMSANVQGQALNIVQMKKQPGKLAISIAIAGNTMFEQKANGDKVSVKQLGNTVPIDEAGKFALKVEANIIPELGYDEIGVSVKLAGIENLEGQDAYVVELAYQGGIKVKNYYSTDTGLKLRETTFVQSPQGEISQARDFSDYKAIDGIKFPHTIKVPLQPGFSVPAKVTSLKLNGDIADNQFE